MENNFGVQRPPIMEAPMPARPVTAALTAELKKKPQRKRKPRRKAKKIVPNKRRMLVAMVIDGKDNPELTQLILGVGYFVIGMDDDKRALLYATLANNGYRVLEVNDGFSATQ